MLLHKIKIKGGEGHHTSTLKCGFKYRTTSKEMKYRRRKLTPSQSPSLTLNVHLRFSFCDGYNFSNTALNFLVSLFLFHSTHECRLYPSNSTFCIYLGISSFVSYTFSNQTSPPGLSTLSTQTGGREVVD